MTKIILVCVSVFLSGCILNKKPEVSSSLVDEGCREQCEYAVFSSVERQPKDNELLYSIVNQAINQCGRNGFLIKDMKEELILCGALCYKNFTYMEAVVQCVR